MWTTTASDWDIPEACRVCVDLGTGTCIGNRCRCFTGYLGLNCTDRPTTPRAQAPLNQSNNAIAITAGVLGGILITVIIGLIIYFWRKQSKPSIPSYSLRESNRTTLTTTISNERIVVPALYSTPSIQEYSASPSLDTISCHFYEEPNILETEKN